MIERGLFPYSQNQIYGFTEWRGHPASPFGEYCRLQIPGGLLIGRSLRQVNIWNQTPGLFI